tara:strand:+ start:15412 stop:16632 length:1221 start_codon:yes stop_codon:yes gene_type:complete
MKALYVISNPFYYTLNPVGGSISSGTGVIQALKKQGFEVDILSDDKLPTINQETSISYLRFHNLLIRKLLFQMRVVLPHLIFNQLTKIFFELSIKYTLPNILELKSYDLVYIRASHYAGEVLRVVSNQGISSILEVNKPLSMQPFNKSQGFEKLKKSEVPTIPAELDQYEFCTMISVDSTLRAKWITDYVAKKFKNKIFVNHNGVNENLFSLGARTNYTETVGMASSFRWYNDIDEMFRIFSLVISQKKDIIFKLFVGDINKKRVLIDKIKDLNLSNNVSLELEVPLHKMPSLMSNCDILISHFNFHGVWPHNCSIKHLEYMSLSKPVVATNVGEVNFAIKDGHNGILVDEGDEKGFAEAIIYLLNNKEHSIKLGKNGRKDIMDYHTWDKHVERSLIALKSYETNK